MKMEWNVLSAWASSMSLWRVKNSNVSSGYHQGSGRPPSAQIGQCKASLIQRLYEGVMWMGCEHLEGWCSTPGQGRAVRCYHPKPKGQGRWRPEHRGGCPMERAAERSWGLRWAVVLLTVCCVVLGQLLLCLDLSLDESSWRAREFLCCLPSTWHLLNSLRLCVPPA